MCRSRRVPTGGSRNPRFARQSKLLGTPLPVALAQRPSPRPTVFRATQSRRKSLSVEEGAAIAQVLSTQHNQRSLLVDTSQHLRAFCWRKHRSQASLTHLHQFVASSSSRSNGLRIARSSNRRTRLSGMYVKLEEVRRGKGLGFATSTTALSSVCPCALKFAHE